MLVIHDRCSLTGEAADSKRAFRVSTQFADLARLAWGLSPPSEPTLSPGNAYYPPSMREPIM